MGGESKSIGQENLVFQMELLWNIRLFCCHWFPPSPNNAIMVYLLVYRFEGRCIMDRKILEYIREYRMVSPGDRVIVALSGGADSVCLLSVLKELEKELKIELFAVHVHHGLRGEEADRDSAYAQELSGDLGVPFVCVHANVTEYAREHVMSEEEAGRHLRYQILEEQRKKVMGTKIAVAHHADDQVETVLYHLFRGSGLKGLGGIRPVRDSIIRPLLSVTRIEILAYLREKEISYCEDSTNAETDYVRNRLRHEIIPAVRERINEGAPANIRKAGKMAAEADAYFEKMATRIIEEHGIVSGSEKTGINAVGIAVSSINKEERIIRRYVIRHMIAGVVQSLKDISSVHVEETEKLLFKPVGRSTRLPGGLCAVRTYDELWIKNQETELFVENDRGEMETVPEMTTFPYKKGQEIPKNRYTKWFDYDKINSTLSVRHRETGDYITLADGGRKTVKSFMIDEKIPKEERGNVLLVADGPHILWIIGYRISEYYKITDDTHTVLQIQVDGGKNNE